MNNFDLIKNKIRKQLKKSEVDVDFLHSQLTWKWLLRLKPNADIPLQIAAIGHDYERSFPDRERSKFHTTYGKYKQKHALKSAQMIAGLMKEYKFLPSEIKRTKELIKHHEIGGKGDIQILTDADSLAFFEGNARFYGNIHPQKEVKSKFIFMYHRMSDKAKELLKEIKFKNKDAYKLYQRAVNSIEL